MILPDPRFQIDVAESEADRSSPPRISSASADAKSTEHIRTPQASDFSTAAKALAGVEQFPAELLSPDTRVSLSISAFHPLIERLRRAANLSGNRSHRRPPRRMILHVLESQPNGACTHFG